MTSNEIIDIGNGIEVLHDRELNKANLGEYAVALQVAMVTDLGPNNAGIFGPLDDIEKAASQQLILDLAKPEYSKPASNCWICVDGRSSHEEITAAEAGEVSVADPQIGGSLPVSETAASYMDGPETHQPLTTVIPAKTKAATEDGLRVKVHGANSNKAGCVANAGMRDVLGFLVTNSDIILPKAWELLKVAKLDDVLEQDDLIQSVLSANSAANNDNLWDATPEDVIDLAVANGAEYMDLVGSHNEKATRADMSKDGAFAKARFVLDHMIGDEQIQAFSASFGAYASITLKRAARHNVSRRDAALQIARVYLYNVALTKKLKNDAMPVGVLAEVN